MKQYEVVVRGHFTPTLRSAFVGYEITTRDGDTVLRGEIPDHAALQGLLDRILRLGLELVELHRCP
jgi:hypothetical protein